MAEPPTVVLTGASSGIGLAALEALASDTFVIAVSRTKPPTEPAHGDWVEADLREPEHAAARILDVLKTRGLALDGLIHCAASYGSTQRHDLVHSTDDEWDEVMSVNVRSQFILTTRLLPLLLTRPQAFIAGLTSDVATRPAPHRIPYACSKAASYALFSSLSAELQESSVSVIQLQPAGQVVTPGLRQRRPRDFDFSGYSSPQIFAEYFRSIVRARGRGMNGMSLVVS